MLLGQQPALQPLADAAHYYQCHDSYTTSKTTSSILVHLGKCIFNAFRTEFSYNAS